MSASRWDTLGQELERDIDPLGYELKAAVAPWSVAPGLLEEEEDEDGDEDE